MLQLSRSILSYIYMDWLNPWTVEPIVLRLRTGLQSAAHVGRTTEPRRSRAEDTEGEDEFDESAVFAQARSPSDFGSVLSKLEYREYCGGGK
jgi:hypothetical protein